MRVPVALTLADRLARGIAVALAQVVRVALEVAIPVVRGAAGFVIAVVRAHRKERTHGRTDNRQEGR